jgi:hypothetical protein
VKTVFDSVVDIAGGAIGAAAQKVEQSMAQAIPMILGFLAEQLGLGGIGKAIQEVMEKIRKPVDKIVDKIVNWIVTKAKKLIERIKKMFGKGKPQDSNARANANDPAANAPNPQNQQGPSDSIVGKDIGFSAGGETHHLWIDTAGSGARVMVASDKKEVPDQLNEWKAIYDKKDNDDPDKQKMNGIINDARGIHSTTLSEAVAAEKQMKEAQSMKTEKENQEATSADNRVESSENALVAPLRKGFELAGNKDKPRPILTKQTVVKGGGTSGEAIAFPVTKNTNGNDSRVDIPAWEHAKKLNAAKGEDKTGATGRSGDWVRGHIISWKMGGDGTLQNNIFIIDRSANGNMSTLENNADKELTRLISKPEEGEEDKVMFYEVGYDYWGEEYPLNGFGHNIYISYGKAEIDGTAKQYIVTNKRVTSTEPSLDTSEISYNLNNIGWESLYELTRDTWKIKAAFAQNLTRIRNEYDKFDNIDDLSQKMKAFHDSSIANQTVKDQIIVLKQFVSDDLKFKL